MQGMLDGTDPVRNIQDNCKISYEFARIFKSLQGFSFKRSCLISTIYAHICFVFLNLLHIGTTLIMMSHYLL